jgi:hypothetical protein
MSELNPDSTFDEVQTHADHWSIDFNGFEAVQETRAGSAFRTLSAYAEKAYGGSVSEPVEQGIRDLIVDLHHLADMLDLDMNVLIERASAAYRNDIEEV